MKNTAVVSYPWSGALHVETLGHVLDVSCLTDSNLSARAIELHADHVLFGDAK